MKQINTGKAELLFIKHEFGDHPFILKRDIDQVTEKIIQLLYCRKLDIFIELPEGNWGEPDNPFEFTEEQWKEIIPCELIGTIEPYNLYWLYPDYERSNLDGFETAICSGYSLLRANKIYRENPYGNGESGHNAVDRDWAETQPHVGNWIVLIKVKEE